MNASLPSARWLDWSVVGRSIARAGNSDSSRVTGKVQRMEVFLCGRKDAAVRGQRRWSRSRISFSDKHNSHTSSFMLISSAPWPHVGDGRGLRRGFTASIEIRHKRPTNVLQVPKAKTSTAAAVAAANSADRETS
jgi:hypothetical protein